MRILITGASGQVGKAVVDVCSKEHTVLPYNHANLDVSLFSAVSQIVELQPDIVIHPAAFTNVDACAREPERALRINALGTKHVALACQALDIPLVYISTNEVFDGRGNTPYLEFDRPAPINSYAYSKWAGEVVVQQLLRKFYIVRVAWVFGGERNFVQTMLKLADERAELAVVDDEIGSPTYSHDIAHAVAQLIRYPGYGIYHFVNEGYCSRYEFAKEIFRQAGRTDIVVRPIKLADYRRDSTPPAFTPLRNFVGATDLGIQLPPWQNALERFVKSVRQAEP